MTEEEALAMLEDRVDQAREAADVAKGVEAAFKLEAQKAQRAYIKANREAPHTEATRALDKLHRDAVRQWARAQADAGRAYRSMAALNSKLSRRAADGARSGQEARNGAQVHSGPARPLEGHHGRTG